MIRTTTSNLDGKEIEKYLGVVVGEAILGANIFKDLFGAVRDIVGGRAGAYENELSRPEILRLQKWSRKLCLWAQML